MITLTAECLCDRCGRVVASGQPAPASSGDNSHWIWSACHTAEQKARNHSALVTITTVTCKECLENTNNHMNSKALEIIGDRIENLKCEPTRESMQEVANILAALLCEIARIDHIACRASDTASCLANGIQPD